MRPRAMRLTIADMDRTKTRGSSLRRRVVSVVALLVGIGRQSVWVAQAETNSPPNPGPGKYHHSVAMPDGVELDGWVLLPEAVRAGPVPTVLLFTMYAGNLDSPGNDPQRSVTEVEGQGIPKQSLDAERLLEEGYAVATFSVRGSGESGGCFDYFGPRDAHDGAELVEWVARQAWSNGRVGMTGNSQEASMAMQTATLAPPHLDAVTLMAPSTDAWLFTGTPNGVFSAFYSSNTFAVNVGTGAVPPIYRSPDGAPYLTPTWAPTYGASATARLCENTARGLEAAMIDALVHGKERDAEWWTERRFSDDLSNVRAATLFSMGTTDTTSNGYGIEAVGWDRLPSQKAMIVGTWGHASPPDGPHGSWEDAKVAWFDRYLKGDDEDGIRAGTVAIQTDNGEWHYDRSWPIGRSETVTFATEDREFTSAADVVTGYGTLNPCAGEGATQVSYVTEVAEATTFTGAGVAELTITSDKPAGQVGVTLFELDRSFDCVTNPSAYKLITGGAADLQFHEDLFLPEDFPVDTPTAVRIDLESMSHVVEAGNRVAIVVSNGDATYRGGMASTPHITVHGGSHIVLAPAGGRSLGGAWSAPL